MYKAFDRACSRIVDFRIPLMYPQSKSEGPWVICESVDAPAQFPIEDCNDSVLQSRGAVKWLWRTSWARAMHGFHAESTADVL